MAFSRPDPQLIELVAQSVRNAEEHSMVRHEAAIALGSIGGLQSREVLEALVLEFSGHQSGQSLDETLVLESCVVALESLKYWQSC
jgi:deoxyhypusine monooxygenase